MESVGSGGIQQIMRFIPDVSQVKKALSGIQAQLKNINSSIKLNVTSNMDSEIISAKKKVLVAQANLLQAKTQKELFNQQMKIVNIGEKDLKGLDKRLQKTKQMTAEVDKQVMTFNKMFTSASYFWVKAIVMYNAIKTVFRPIMMAERGETVISNILPLYGIEDLQTRVALSKKYMKDLLDYGAKIGIDITRVSEPYSQFLASPIEGLKLEQQDQIAKSFLKLGAALQIDPVRVESMFLALSQMASKGKISMEELRRQLSNALPGSFALAAASMKITTAELEERVRVGSITVTQLLTAISSEIETRYANFQKPNTLTQAIIDLKNAFSQLMMAMREGGMVDTLTFLIKGVTQLLNILKAFAPLLSLLAAISIVAFSALLINKFTHGLMAGLGVMKLMTMELLKIKTLTATMPGVGHVGGGAVGFGRKINTASLMAPMISSLVGTGLSIIGNNISDINKPSMTASSFRVGGSALQYAGIGAILGSAVPVIGNITGAITGAVVGAGTQIYQEIKASNEYQKNKDALNQTKETRIRLDMNINNKNGSDIDFSHPSVMGGLANFNIVGYTGDQVR